jgi:hypothetical protein
VDGKGLLRGGRKGAIDMKREIKSNLPILSKTYAALAGNSGK